MHLLSRSTSISYDKLSMGPLRIFLTTWNTGLQGSKAQSQDLSSWLLPVLHKSTAESDDPAGLIPDLYAVAVQELLPVHLAREWEKIACDLSESMETEDSRGTVGTGAHGLDRPHTVCPFRTRDIAVTRQEARKVLAGFTGISRRQCSLDLRSGCDHGGQAWQAAHVVIGLVEAQHVE